MEALESANGSVSITFSKAEALVLFDWMQRVEAEGISWSRLGVVDQAEQRVLWDISASLESVLVEPFGPGYAEVIDAARNEVRDPTD